MIMKPLTENTPAIHLECLYHVPHSNWAYLYDCNTCRLRFRTKKAEVDQVCLEWGDKYDWEATYTEQPMDKVATDFFYDYWETAVKPPFNRFSYGFRCHAGEETVWMVENGVYAERPEPGGGYYEQPYLHEIDRLNPPEWAKSAVFYQIMPDRFANGDTRNDPPEVSPWGDTPTRESFFGGDLQGIMDHLDYLCDLGITALYLTPLFTAPSNHKYDTVDYWQVDPHIGDLALLKALTAAAHERGIRVVLDAVFNHIGVDSPQFQHVIEHGESSPYADWFHIRRFPVLPGQDKPAYDTFGFFAHMPKLNTAHPATRDYLLDVARYWLSEVGIDGWRLDVSNEIDHAFWRAFRTMVKEINPEALIIGETWSDSMRWLQGDQFDSVMNYPLADRLLDYLMTEETDAYSFAAELHQLLMRYPQQANEVMFNLPASHDTPRLLTLLGEDKRKLKLAVAFLMTFTGMPCLFYGDEVGLTGGDDPDCRKCMVWEDDQQDRELLAWYKAMIRLRKEHPVLTTGHFRVLHANRQEKALVFERWNEQERMAVWFNPSSQPLTTSVALTGEWEQIYPGGGPAFSGDRISLQLSPFSCRIMKAR